MGFSDAQITEGVETYFWLSTKIIEPIPAVVWLLGSGLIGLVGLRRRFKK